MIESHYSFAQVSYDHMVERYKKHEDKNIPRIQKNPRLGLYTQFTRNIIDSFPMEAIQNPNSYHAWLYVMALNTITGYLHFIAASLLVITKLLTT